MTIEILKKRILLSLFVDRLRKFPLPDEIDEDGNDIWVRHCSKCNKKLTYTCKRFKKRADASNGMCISCAGTKYFLPPRPWIKKCVKCSKDVIFVTVQGFLSKAECKCKSCIVCKKKKNGYIKKDINDFRNEFINKARNIHGDKFDYSRMEYVNGETNVTIVCPVHGEFIQKPSRHLKSKHACYKCYRPNPKKKYVKKVKIPAIPDEMIDGKGYWIRNCPKCNRKVKHRNKYYRDEAIDKLCVSCKNTGRIPSADTKNKWKDAMKTYWDNRKNGKMTVTSLMDGKVYYNDNGVWCRKCPQCKDEIEYSRKDNAIGSEQSNAKCIPCNKGSKKKIKIHKHVNGVFLNSINKVWCRKCPSCNKHIEYSSKYWAMKAQEKNTECYDCLSSRYVSKSEEEFLDYFNIEDRQKRIDVYVVDGIKGQVIYEFLGDFWHGNPKYYDLNDINRVNKKTFKELYEHTLQRFKYLKDKGYEIKYIWESDWNEFTKTKLLDNSKFKYFNGIDI